MGRTEAELSKKKCNVKHTRIPPKRHGECSSTCNSNSEVLVGQIFCELLPLHYQDIEGSRFWCHPGMFSVYRGRALHLGCRQEKTLRLRVHGHCFRTLLGWNIAHRLVFVCAFLLNH